MVYTGVVLGELETTRYVQDLGFEPFRKGSKNRTHPMFYVLQDRLRSREFFPSTDLIPSGALIMNPTNIISGQESARLFSTGLTLYYAIGADGVPRQVKVTNREKEEGKPARMNNLYYPPADALILFPPIRQPLTHNDITTLC